MRAGAPIGCNSFAPGTRVLMADGLVLPIDEVEVGDLVAAEDPSTGAQSAQPVLDVIVGSGEKHLIVVTTREQSDTANRPSSATWTATGDHPVYVVGEGWQDAKDLAVGDLLLGVVEERRLVTRVFDRGAQFGRTVYNLMVGNVHTFFVGANDLVHNSNKCGVGGVYSMRDKQGNVVRTGMTNDLNRRGGEHYRKYGAQYDFRVEAVSSDRSTRRGLEQLLH